MAQHFTYIPRIPIALSDANSNLKVEQRKCKAKLDVSSSSPCVELERRMPFCTCRNAALGEGNPFCRSRSRNDKDRSRNRNRNRKKAEKLARLESFNYDFATSGIRSCSGSREPTSSTIALYYRKDFGEGEREGDSLKS